MGGITNDQNDIFFVVLLNKRDFDFNGFRMMSSNFKFSIVDQKLSFLEIRITNNPLEVLNQIS